MTDAVQIALIASVSPTVVAAAGFFKLWSDIKATKSALAADLAANTAKTVETAAKVTEVHQQINSRMDELLELTRTSAKAEGIKQEQDSPSK